MPPSDRAFRGRGRAIEITDQEAEILGRNRFGDAHVERDQTALGRQLARSGRIEIREFDDEIVFTQSICLIYQIGSCPYLSLN